MSVIKIIDYQPHIGGEAKCLSCGYVWEAIAPIGAVELECSECHTFKGVFTGMVVPDLAWTCDCDNQHFYIDPKGAMCSRCGLRQVMD